MNGGGAVNRFSESAPRPPVFPGKLQMKMFQALSSIHLMLLFFIGRWRKCAPKSGENGSMGFAVRKAVPAASIDAVALKRFISSPDAAPAWPVDGWERLGASLRTGRRIGLNFSTFGRNTALFKMGRKSSLSTHRSRWCRPLRKISRARKLLPSTQSNVVFCRSLIWFLSIMNSLSLSIVLVRLWRP